MKKISNLSLADVLEEDKTECPITKPKHYINEDIKCECGRVIECLTIVRHFNFTLGNVIKYIWRAFRKGNVLEDLKKARFYLDDEIKRLEAIEAKKLKSD